VHLALNNEWVDLYTAVINGNIFENLDLTGLGVKGVGEAGTIGAASTVINAIIDALSGLGVTEMPMPASPQTVWRAIQSAAQAK